MICDDEEIVCLDIKRVLEQESVRTGKEVLIRTFVTGRDLLEYLKEEHDVDLIFLDIMLPDLEGIKIGSYVRDTIGNHRVQIVFISSEQSYAMSLFDIQPFHFLVKPIEETVIRDVFARYCAIYQKEEEYFTYRKGKSIQKIRLSDIYYITCEGRKIHIVTEQGKETYEGSMRSLHGKYENRGLWSVSYSEVINSRYVKDYRKDEVIMCDGYHAQISKRYKKKLRKKI